MMGPKSDTAMGRPRLADSQPHAKRQWRRARIGAIAALTLLNAAPLLAGQKEVPYPSTDLFRRLQLDVLDCGRENNSTSCDAARKVGDPLMDHPRLPASCKDLLWTIREKAVVAPTNSFNRREALNRAAADLMPVCRERDAVKPAAKPEDKKGPSLKF
jgi:hypothetical protein